MFFVRSIFVDEPRVETSTLELEPTHELAQKVCRVVEEFLHGKPQGFREKMPFLNKGNFELDWNAAAGGVAMATIFESEQPLAVLVLLLGADPQSDFVMLQMFRDHVLVPVLSSLSDGSAEEHATKLIDTQDRPVVLQLLFPGSPEWTPTIQLLSTALGSVYFRAMRRMEPNPPEV